MKKWRTYSDIIVLTTLILLHIISSIKMSGGELSGRLLAMGGHLDMMDLTMIVIFLASRVLLIVFLVPYIGYRLCNRLIFNKKQ